MTASPVKIAISMCTPEEAPAIARALVERRLAACVNILPAVKSMFRWQEKIEAADEAMLVIKTTEEMIPLVEQALQSLHSYELPEFLVLSVENVSDAYLKWIEASVR